MFFPSLAYAMGASPQGGAQGGGNPIAAFAPLIIMFVIFYFLLIRPQQKKAKQHKEYLAALKKGDYVITSGGLYGRIVEVENEVLTIELNKDLQVKVNRSFITGAAEPQKENKKSKNDKS